MTELPENTPAPPAELRYERARAERSWLRLALVVLGLAAVAAVAFIVWRSTSAGTPSVAASDSTLTHTSVTDAPLATSDVADQSGAPVTASTSPSPSVISPPSGADGITGTMVGTCDSGGTCGVKQRTAPRTSADRLVPHDLVDGETVVVVCSASGDSRTNAGTTSAEWYRIENGAYLPSVYVTLGSTASLRTCG